VGWSGTHGAATVAEEEDRAPCLASGVDLAAGACLFDDPGILLGVACGRQNTTRGTCAGIGDLGAGGLPAPVALPVGRIRVASPALPPPSSILGGQSTTGRESLQVFGWTKKRATPEPICNRTDSIASSPDQTTRALTGDVAVSISPLLAQD
jgi:hypothetical protein